MFKFFRRNLESSISSQGDKRGEESKELEEKEKLPLALEELLASLLNDGVSLIYSKEKLLNNLKISIKRVKSGESKILEAVLTLDGCCGLRLFYDDLDKKFKVLACNSFIDAFYNEKPDEEELKLKKIARKYHQREIIV